MGQKSSKSNKKKICAVCKLLKTKKHFYKCSNARDGLGYECKDCRRKMKSDYREKNREKVNSKEREKRHVLRDYYKRYFVEWRKKNKRKAYCDDVVKIEIRRGTLKRQPCQVCGDKKSSAHHPDYRRPRYIMWLCHKDHTRLHKQTGWKLPKGVKATEFKEVRKRKKRKLNKQHKFLTFKI